MSFYDRVTNIQEDAESDAFAQGSDGGFYGRMQAKKPKAIMVRPAGATWDYNPVTVREELGSQDLDSILEDIVSIDDAIGGYDS